MLVRLFVQIFFYSLLLFVLGFLQVFFYGLLLVVLGFFPVLLQLL